MTLHFTKKLMLVTIGLLFVTGLAFASFYYLKIKPVQQTISQVKTSVTNEERLLATYENKENELQEKPIKNSTNLQKKVPVKPVLEQFLLDLERAEVVSNSFIASMSFSHGEVSVDPTTEVEREHSEGNQLGSSGQIEQAEAIQNDNVPQEQPPGGVTTPPPSNLPPGMKRLTIHLSVVSPDYYSMETFLKAIEDLERITKIDTLSFTGKPEKRTIMDDEEDPSLSYNLTISTFYHPGLEQLQNEMPLFEIPEPGNKKNPLAQPGSRQTQVEDVMKPIEEYSITVDSSNVAQDSYEQKGEQETNSTMAQPLDRENVKLVPHTVKDGESLYTLSMLYFKSRKGEERIKSWNNMKDNTIYVGQIIEIPLEK